MRKINNGKLYDTDTAVIIGNWSYGNGPRDFNHISETLYRKQNGEYFLYGEGGPLTKYVEHIGTNEYCGGEDITPMTFREAKEWAEYYLDADEYIAAFGAPEE